MIGPLTEAVVSRFSGTNPEEDNSRATKTDYLKKSANSKVFLAVSESKDKLLNLS